jgi:hypothetical protein
MPPAHWLAGLIAVIALLSGFVLFTLAPYVHLLVSASDALCGGDVEFVATIDGAGIPAWGYPDTAHPGVVAARGYPDGAPPGTTGL